MGKSVVLLLLFAAFLAVPRFSSAESTTINFNFKGLIPGGSCEAEPCEECEECEQCEQCPEGPTKDLIALSTSLGLTTVYEAAEACDLIELFTNPNVSHTVFAPSNEAFDFLPEGFLDFLIDSPELCSSLLLGHVVGAVLPTTAMVDGMTVPPIVGEFPLTFDLTVGVTVSVVLSSATVISADNFATNGVIHVIDKLLVSIF
ncbi:Stabilin-2 [Balamuthia mandrillaris]